MADASLTIDGVEVLKKTSGEINLTNTNFVPNSSFMFRNKIINGGMKIAQRGAGAVTTANSYPVDRFSCLHSTDGAFSAQQDSSAPSGFTNSIKWTTTNADSSLAATQHAIVRQRVEGNNIYDLGFGTTSAKTITLSFWVKSSLTGTFGGSLLNNGQTRCYPFSYTISTEDTWEHKKITIPGDTDTSITWLTSNGVGFELFWSMGVGADYSGTAGAWTSTPYQYSFTNAVSVIGTPNANWYLTGVQLEIGSVATPFEHRPIGMELSLCQRYYFSSSFKFGGRATTGSGNRETISYPTTMRAAASVTLSSESKTKIGTTFVEVETKDNFTVYFLGSETSDATLYSANYAATAEL